MPPPREAPLVVHVVDYFEAGGLENGLANLVNHMPREAYRHAVVCVKGYTAFSSRVRRDDVPFISLDKKPGADPGWYARLWTLLRRLRPAIVHTRNLGTLEAQAVASVAGRAVRIHGEHGRDVWDLHGASRKYNLLRTALRPVVDRYIAVSGDLEQWLTAVVGIPRSRVTRIYNGVDTTRFSPAPEQGRRWPGLPWHEGGSDRHDGLLTIGWVGRMVEVKDPLTLMKAFLHLLRREPPLRTRLRLAMAGDGPLRARCLALARAEGAESLVWMPGKRDDIADILRACDLFVLPSIAEGTSNTILEAMATGLPVVATNVGGTPELVADGVTGALVPASDHVALAGAIRRYVDRPALARQHGAAGRSRVVSHFGLQAMVGAYVRVYEEMLDVARRAPARVTAGVQAR